jgi:hypothetical protein
MGHDLSSQVGLSLAPMTDGLDVVAVRIAYEGSEVVRVVLGPQARRVKYLSTAGERGIEKRPYRRAIGCGERDMRLTEPLPGDLVSNPELGLGWWSVADCHSEVHDPLASQRRQHFVVEARAGTYVGALDREMVEHCAIIVHEHRRRHPWANSFLSLGYPTTAVASSGGAQELNMDQALKVWPACHRPAATSMAMDVVLRSC